MRKRIAALLIAFVLLVSCMCGIAYAKGNDDGPVRDESSTGKLEFRLYGEYGNAEMYSVENVEPLEDNVLTGRTFY